MLVMESAATRRSFLRFLLEPENQKRDKKKQIDEIDPPQKTAVDQRPTKPFLLA